MRARHPPYITIGHGIGGWYAVLRVWYEDMDGYDNWGTGIGRYETAEEAREEAEEWAMAEGIEVV